MTVSNVDEGIANRHVFYVEIQIIFQMRASLQRSLKSQNEECSLPGVECGENSEHFTRNSLPKMKNQTGIILVVA